MEDWKRRYPPFLTERDRIILLGGIDMINNAFSESKESTDKDN